MVKFRVTETIAQTYLDGEGILPFDLDGLATSGTDATPRVKRVSVGTSLILPPYNNLPPQLTGAPSVGVTLSLTGDSWSGGALFDYEWLVDSVVYATTETLLIVEGLRGKTITARKRAQGISGSASSDWVSATNSLYIPATIGDGVLLPDEYGFSEAVSDVDTRKTSVLIQDTPPVGYEWIIYRGNNSDGDLATVATPFLDGTNWAWTSGGTSAVGTGPTGRTPVYVRIGLRETAVPTNKYFVTPAGEFFLASSIPGAPVVTFATGTGQGEIEVNLPNGSDDAGRALTRYEYQLDTGSWLTLPGGTVLGLRTINTGNPTTTYVVKVRAVNANGNGIATTGFSVASGTTTVVPAQVASDAWTVTDKPSTLGNTVTLSYTGALPASGGDPISTVGYKLNSGAFVPLGLTLPITVDVTVPVTTLATFDVQAQNSMGFSIASTKTVTPTTTSTLTAIAEFGALTPALAGGWRPTTALGDEIELVSVFSQTGCTRTWSIVDGALVANGTPDVDNTKTVVVTTVLGNNVSTTIATTATAWSVRTPTELSAALGYSASSALTIFMRPVTFDIQTGTATVTLSGTPRVVGRFYNRNYSAAPSHRKVTKHPSQVKRWRATKTSYVNGTQYLWLDEVDFWNEDPGGRQHITHQSGVCNFLKITNFSCSAPDIDTAILNDPTRWPAYPTVPMTNGFYLPAETCTNIWLENGVFKNCYSPINLSTGGNLRLLNLTIDTFYFDGFRLFPNGDKAPKLVKDLRIINCWAIYDEQGTTGAVHPDSIQPQGGTGTVQNVVYSNIEIFKGPLRGNNLSCYQGTASVDRAVFWNFLGNSFSIPGAFLSNGSELIIGNSVFQNGSGSGAAYIRLGGPPGHATWKISGEIMIFNTAAVANTGSALMINQNSEVNDFVTPTRSNCVDANGASDLVPYFNDVYLVPTTVAELRTKYTANPGQTVGPLDEAGAWRSEDFPPLPGGNPVTGASSLVLAHAGADLLITPGTSMLYHTLPTVWDYKYRNANGVNNWTKVEGRTGANATLVAPNKTGIQVKCRWRNSLNIPGPWSETQTVIV
jgi:hypothetical protein